MAFERRISYGATLAPDFNREGLHPDISVEIRAIDLMIGELKKDPTFEEQFQKSGKTLADHFSLNGDDPKDVLHDVHTVEECFCAVVINSSIALDHSGAIVDNSERIQEWGQRILRIAGNGVDCSCVDKQAKKKLASLVMNEGIFGIVHEPEAYKLQAIPVGRAIF